MISRWLSGDFEPIKMESRDQSGRPRPFTQPQNEIKQQTLSRATFPPSPSSICETVYDLIWSRLWDGKQLSSHSPPSLNILTFDLISLNKKEKNVSEKESKKTSRIDCWGEKDKKERNIQDNSRRRRAMARDLGSKKKEKNGKRLFYVASETTFYGTARTTIRARLCSLEPRRTVPRKIRRGK